MASFGKMTHPNDANDRELFPTDGGGPTAPWWVGRAGGIRVVGGISALAVSARAVDMCSHVPAFGEANSSK